MDVNLEVLLIAFCSLLMGGGTVYVFMRSHLKIAESFYKREEEAHKHELEDAKFHGLSVLCFPYQEESGSKGFWVDSRSAEIGYKYQLFINGVPIAGEPHKVVVKKLYKSEFSLTNIQAIKKEVLSIIDMLASKNPAIALAKSAGQLAADRDSSSATVGTGRGRKKALVAAE
jgi:hypothetical protein